jgi:hypothetical protein
MKLGKFIILSCLADSHTPSSAINGRGMFSHPQLLRRVLSQDRCAAGLQIGWIDRQKTKSVIFKIGDNVV